MIRWIQRIKTKSKSSMVTRNTPYLTTDTFIDVVVNKDISSTVLWDGIYSQWWVTMDISNQRYSNGNAHSITMNGNVSVVSWVIPLVTIPFLELVMIHWIRWIQWNKSRKNPIKMERMTLCLTLVMLKINYLKYLVCHTSNFDSINRSTPHLLGWRTEWTSPPEVLTSQCFQPMKVEGHR